MRYFKLFGLFAAAGLVLLGVLLIVVVLTVNPNRFKPQIAAAVKQATGRELQLVGDIRLSVIPWVALELGPARLGNPPGFGAEPFLSVTHAKVRIKLLPLLHKRLEIARVEIEGLDVRLRKNAQGRGNWQDAEAKAVTAAEPAPAAPSLQSFANIHVQGGRVSFENLDLENIDFETGALSGDMLPVSMKFDAQRAPTHLSLIAKLDLSERAVREMRISDLHASGTVGGSGGDRPAHWELAAPALSLDLNRQTAAAAAFTFSYSSAQLTGSFEATRILDNLSASGSLKLGSLVPREFAPRLGIALPPTRDPKVLTQLSASTDFAYDATALGLSHLQVRLDDTTLQGSLKLLQGAAPALQFDLSADQIDLDRYRSPEHPVDRQSPAASTDDPKSKPLEVGGTFTLKAARIAHLDLADVHVTVTRHDQVLRLFPIEAQVDGGRYTGNISVDGRGSLPLLSVDEHLSGIDMTRLLASTSGKGRISGRATLTLKGTARGADSAAILKSLNGQMAANLAEGALEGIDVGYEIGQAQALIDRSSPPARANSGKTKFDAVQFSAQIANGIAQTHDLLIASPALKVTGEGSANLSTQAIDFKLLADLLTAGHAQIPLKVSGTYASPAVRPDVEALAKGQLKQKLQDVLKKNGLQGLFK